MANGLDPRNANTAFIGNGADFGLYTTNYIIDNSATFGLYPSNALLDLAVGDIGVEIMGTNANLWLEMWQSDGLNTWTNAGPDVYWQLPVDADKKFFRIRANP